MPAYPATLPLPTPDFSERLNTPQARTTMESGRTRNRQRFSTELSTYDVAFNFTNEELAIFKEWWRTDLEGGTLWFTITLPIGDEYVDMSVRFENGDFSNQYRDFGVWVVSARLERETVQEVADPVTSPVPVWYRPTVNILGDTTIDESDNNALYTVTTELGRTVTLTFPDYVSLANALRIGVINNGLGGVLLVAANGDAGLASTEEIPAYLDLATLSYVTEGYGDPWTTDGADEDSGNLTAWPDYKANGGNLAPATPVGVQANGDLLRSIPMEGGFVVADAPVVDSSMSGVLVTFRIPGDPSLRMIPLATLAGTAQSTCGFSVRISTYSTESYILLMNNSTELARFTISAEFVSQAGTGASIAFDDKLWHTLGILWDETVDSFKLVLNGAEIAKTSGAAGDLSAATFHRLGTVDSYKNLDIGDVCFYKGLSPADMIAFSAEARDRWNTMPEIDAGASSIDLLANLPGARLAWDKTSQMYATSDGTGSEVAEGANVRSIKNKVTGEAVMYNATTDFGQKHADGLDMRTVKGVGNFATGLATSHREWVYGFVLKKEGTTSLFVGALSGLATSHSSASEIRGATTEENWYARGSGNSPVVGEAWGSAGGWDYLILTRRQSALSLSFNGGPFVSIGTNNTGIAYLMLSYSSNGINGIVNTCFFGQDHTQAPRVRQILKRIADGLNGV